MIVRASVCAIDWNWNVGRIQKVDEAGNLLYREKVMSVNTSLNTFNPYISGG